MRKQFTNISKRGYDNTIFGVSWNKGSSPTLTRTDASVGMVANAGVDNNKVINNFDGSPIFGEITEVTDTYGNVFVRIPKFYIKKTDSANLKTWQISKVKHTGFYLPWCFWDFTNSKELPYVDIGKYKATKDGSGKLESKPNFYPLANDTIVNFRTYAQANNTGGLLGYQLLDIHVIDILQTLFRVEFATLNSQSIMSGFTSGQYSASHVATIAESSVNRIIIANAYASLYQVGQTISIGSSLGGNQICYGRTITSITTYDANNKAINFDGTPVNIAIGNILYNTGWKNGFSSSIISSSGSLISNSSGLYPCKYRGIESPWGDLRQFIDGVNINNRQAWIAKNAVDYASNVFTSPYEQIGYVNGSTDGYVKEMGYDSNFPFAEFPITVGGNVTAYYSDNYYQATGQLIAIFGGSWTYVTSAGIGCWIFNTPSVSGISNLIGGRLVKKSLN